MQKQAAHAWIGKESIYSLGLKIHILENTWNVSSCFRALSKLNMTYLSNCVFRLFVWNQPFMYCAAFNLWRIIKSWNRKLFRALEATVMATGIGCSPIRFYVCYFFCHCNHSAQVQATCWNFLMQQMYQLYSMKVWYKITSRFQLSISFVSHVIFLIEMAE